MKNNYFNLKMLLDGLVRDYADKKPGFILGAMLSQNMNGRCHGPEADISKFLHNLIDEYFMQSTGVFVGVSQFGKTENLQFELKFFLESGEMAELSLDSAIASDFDFAVMENKLIIKFQISVKEIGHVKSPSRSLKIRILADNDQKTQILNEQLLFLGHACKQIRSQKTESSPDGKVDIVFVDEAISSDQLRVNGVSCFVGLGNTSDLNKKISKPLYLSDIEKILQAEGIMHILIVDDSLPSLQTVSLILQSLGYKTTCVESAQEALSILDNDNFEVLLTDIHLDGESGVELISKVKDAALNLQRIIAMTGSTESDLHKSVFEAGADQLIIKPVRKKKLIQALDFPEVKIINNTELSE